MLKTSDFLVEIFLPRSMAKINLTLVAISFAGKIHLIPQKPSKQNRPDEIYIATKFGKFVILPFHFQSDQQEDFLRYGDTSNNKPQKKDPPTTTKKKETNPEQIATWPHSMKHIT